MDTDQAWQLWAEQEPYYAVLTDPKYLKENLDPEVEALFFESGKLHAQNVYGQLHRRFAVDGPITSAVDFGCGVGRVSYGLTHYCTQVVGVDIAPAMLSLAEAKQSKAQNPISFQLNDAFLQSQQTYQLLHSSLVFQHIRPNQGLKLLSSLLEGVEPKGFAFVQFPTATSIPTVRYWSALFANRIPGFTRLKAKLAEKDYVAAPMEMNIYKHKRILNILRQHGFSHIEEDRQWSAHIEFTTYYARKD